MHSISAIGEAFLSRIFSDTYFENLFSFDNKFSCLQRGIFTVCKTGEINISAFGTLRPIKSIPSGGKNL